VNFTSRPLYPREKNPVPTAHEALWVSEPVSTFWIIQKSFAPTGTQIPDRPAVVQSLPSNHCLLTIHYRTSLSSGHAHPLHILRSWVQISAWRQNTPVYAFRCFLHPPRWVPKWCLILVHGYFFSRSSQFTIHPAIWTPCSLRYSKGHMMSYEHKLILYRALVQ
jgi:hypothetical protein